MSVNTFMERTKLMVFFDNNVSVNTCTIGYLWWKSVNVLPFYNYNFNTLWKLKHCQNLWSAHANTINIIKIVQRIIIIIQPSTE